ncbi:hypothetical protein NW752_012210 [Fusarium irregulare]|uniref:Uncharacterized protein n=1 Tax=Fusarium irregulare TaxID=2494466 RepID=A0A9W8PER9_9HYPO|nr:hypothetical protein NW752_012210 [Fusarium irregulare]KAJ4004333.1 hypothetical protein NW766_011638 [Fusarium irregulare]
MPGIDIESLPLFVYEEIGSYCDNKALTQLISVSVNFYNWFNGSRLKDFDMCAYLPQVAYWLRGLLSERSPRLVPRLKAIKQVSGPSEDFQFSLPPGRGLSRDTGDLSRDLGYGVPDLLVRLLSEMVAVKSVTLDLRYMSFKVERLFFTLMESKPSGMMKHSALNIIAKPELTSAYLGCCDPSKLTSVYLPTDWKVRSRDWRYKEFGLKPGDYTMEYRQLLCLYRDQVPGLKRLRLMLTTDIRTPLKATFREIETITTEFPELEWLIVDEYIGSRPDLIELESDLNWFTDILNSTKLTHLAITICHDSVFLSFQDNNPALSEDQALKGLEYWYQRLLYLLVESCPRLQQLFIKDSEGLLHVVTRDNNVGVSVHHLDWDETSEADESPYLPWGLSG